MKASYLLDNHIIFDATRSELNVEQQVVVLQELENTLLSLFVSRPEEIISKEELFTEGWKGRFATDNSLNRVISTLRTKLGDSSKAPKFIKTVPKKGYCFIASVSSYDNNHTADIDLLEESHEQVSNISNMLTRTAWITLSALLTFLVLGSWWFFIFQASNEPTLPKPQTIHQITYLQGEVLTPALSKSGKHLAYSYRPLPESFLSLYIKPLFSSEHTLVDGIKFDAISPKWSLDNQQLLYQRRSHDDCEIRKIGLNLQKVLISDILVTKCNARGLSVGLSWGETEDDLYFTDINATHAPQHIYHFNIKTGKKSKVFEAGNTSRRGHYFIDYDPVTKQLATLSEYKKNQTLISLIDRHGNEAMQRIVKYPLMSISIMDEGVVYRGENNQLNIIPFNEKREYQLLAPQLQLIESPQFVGGHANKLIFKSGRQLTSTLAYLDGKPILSHFPQSKTPTFSQDGSLYFSSIRSGQDQVWRLSEGKLEQLTNFKEQHNIDSVSVSPDMRYLAVSTQRGISIFNLNSISYEKQPQIELPGVANPTFSPDSLSLIVSKDEHGKAPQVIAYDLQISQLSGSLMTNAKLGFYHPALDGLFYSPANENTLWYADENGSKQILEEVILNSPHEYQLTTNGIIISDSDKNLMLYDITTRSVSPLNVSIEDEFALDESSNIWVFKRNKKRTSNTFIATFM